MLKSIPINEKDLITSLTGQTPRNDALNLMDEIEMEQIRDKRHIFEAYDEFRLKQLFDRKCKK